VGEVAASEPITFDLYFDYQCPYVYRASVLIDAVRLSATRTLDVRWRYFSLTQVNSKDDGWTVWDAPPSQFVKGRLGFAAAEAARRQGRFERFHHALLEARHRDRLDIDQLPVVEQVAMDAGLEIERFRIDLGDREILDALASDHRLAVGTHGVFGTPTFVFAGGASAYVRLADSVAGNHAQEVFDRLVAVAAAEPRILEIKRPRKP
jgi:2-hydroxychromene-2-carboxylate isomerase